jgi:hypothetical protein
MNGADFVKKILNHPKGGIEKLISLGKDTECDWLEFKASLNPKDPPKGKESRAERQSRYWHVVRAIISMQNSQGGAVILGIDDSGKAVGLGASDPENRLEQGTDTFALRSLDPAFRPESFEWITEKRRYKINQKVYSQLFEYSFWDYEDKPILVIIVHPYQTRSNTPILVQETLVNVSNTEREVLLFRQKGDVGKTETLWRFSDIENYSRQNSLSNKFNLLHDAFIHSLTIPFFPAIKSTEKVVKKAQSASFRCIGIDWKHFLDAILPTISACAEIPNYTLEFQVFLIDPNSPDNTPHLADSKEASQRSLGRLEKLGYTQNCLLSMVGVSKPPPNTTMSAIFLTLMTKWLVASVVLTGIPIGISNEPFRMRACLMTQKSYFSSRCGHNSSLLTNLRRINPVGIQSQDIGSSRFTPRLYRKQL